MAANELPICHGLHEVKKSCPSGFRTSTACDSNRLVAYDAERKEARAKAGTHFDEFLEDTMRSLRRAKKHKEDRDLVESHLKAAKLSLRAVEDASRRMR